MIAAPFRVPRKGEEMASACYANIKQAESVQPWSARKTDGSRRLSILRRGIQMFLRLTQIVLFLGLFAGDKTLRRCPFGALAAGIEKPVTENTTAR